MTTSFKSEEKTLKNIQVPTSEQLASIQYFWHDVSGAHVSTITQDVYNHPTANIVAYEVLITSSQILFRRGYTNVFGTISWTWQTLSIYANNGITLGTYARFNDSGIVLGDISDPNYQLWLDTLNGIRLNGKVIAMSETATSAISESTKVDRVVAGLVGSDSKSVEFTVPLEMIVPENMGINVNTLYANFILSDGTCIDGNYTSGGQYKWSLSPYTLSGIPAGTGLTVTMTSTNTLKKGTTSTVVPAHSPVTVEVTQINWNKPSI